MMLVRQVSAFIGATIGLWLLAIYPARQVWGDVAFTASAAAVSLCLVPGLLTLALAESPLAAAPSRRLTFLALGSVIRMAVAGIGALFLIENVSAFREGYCFFVFMLLFYLATLGLEVALVLTSGPRVKTRQLSSGDGQVSGS
jgi:hypothetical protein